MHIPSTINENCLKAYEPKKKYAQRWRNRKIRSFSIGTWDNKIPKTLQGLCIECIAKNWTEYLILDEIILFEDRYQLLDILPDTLPLELSIPKIEDEIYWKKCYTKRWPNKIPKIRHEIRYTRIVRNAVNETNEAYINNVLGDRNEAPKSDSSSKSSSRRTSRKMSLKACASQEQDGRTWKKHYCEMHVKDYLENLRPEDYNPEKIKELCDVCGSYIEILKIDHMISSENSSSKIPLNAIITGLQNLTELSVRFKQDYAKEDFSWNIVNVSYQDITLFARGLEKIRLRTLRITNSDIDCDKVILILKALLKHDLEILDFSHCKISDRGMTALSKFVLENPVKEIFLANNRIGSKGIRSLAYAVAQEPCNIKSIDVRLNQFSDASGNLLINSIANYNTSTTSILMSACGLTGNFAIADALQRSTRLENIDISNNTLGEECGIAILEALKFNTTVKALDLRMCKVPSAIEAEIQNEVYRNKKGAKKPRTVALDKPKIHWDEDLIREIEEALLPSKNETFSSNAEEECNDSPD